MTHRTAGKDASGSAAGGRAFLVTQYGGVLLGRLVGAGLQAATLALYARQATRSEFGTVLAVLGVLTVAVVVFEGGMSACMVRDSSADRDPQRFRSVLRATVMLSSMMVVLSWVVLAVLWAITGSVTFLLVVPLAAWAATEKNGDLLLTVALCVGRAEISAVSLLQRRGLGLLGFLGLSTVCGPTLALSVGLLAGSVVANVLVRRTLGAVVAPGGPVVPAGQLLRAARPFYANSVAAQLRNLDVTVVSLVAGPAIGGVYGLPARMTAPLRIIPTSVAAVSLRYLGDAERGRSALVRRLPLVTTAGMALVMAVLFMGAPQLVVALFGPQYLSSAVPLRILSVGLVFAFVTSFQTSELQARGHERFAALASTLTGVGGLLLAAVGAWAAGAPGATAGLCTSFVAQALVCAHRTRDLRRRP
ncbi:hypothetical protein GCM10027047_34310 [Rhodococcus aerolatus]